MKETSGSVAIKRLSGAKYKMELFRTDLKNVAEKTKSMPDEFINSEGNGITDAFVKYALPLTGGLPKTEYSRQPTESLKEAICFTSVLCERHRIFEVRFYPAAALPAGTGRSVRKAD